MPYSPSPGQECARVVADRVEAAEGHHQAAGAGKGDGGSQGVVVASGRADDQGRYGLTIERAIASTWLGGLRRQGRFADCGFCRNPLGSSCSTNTFGQVFGRKRARVRRCDGHEGLGPGQHHLDHGRVVLVCQHPHDEHAAPAWKHVGQRGCKRLGALGVVTSVHHDGWPAGHDGHQLEAPRPAGRSHSRLDGAFGNPPSASCEHPGRLDGKRGVARLIGGQQRRAVRTITVREASHEVARQRKARIRFHDSALPRRTNLAYGKLAEIGYDQRRLASGRRLGDGAGRPFVVLRIGHHRAPRLDDARLLSRNSRRAVAQQGRMVEPDARDDGHLGRADDVGGIQAPAQPHFKHHDVAPRSSEVHQGHGGHKLELRGMFAGFGSLGLGSLAHLQRCLAKRIQGDGHPVNLDAFLEALDVRAGKKPRPIARCPQDGGQVGAGGALAVRAGHMDEAQAVLRPT